MTEKEWLSCPDPWKLLESLPAEPADRKLRLLAVACCRRIPHLLEDERIAKALECAERFADSLADRSDLDQLKWEQPFDANFGRDPLAPLLLATARFFLVEMPFSIAKAVFTGRVNGLGQDAASIATDSSPRQIAHLISVTAHAAQATGQADPAFRSGPLANHYGPGRRAELAEYAAQANLVRDIFGPSRFHCVTLDPGWLSSTVQQLTEAIYASRDFNRLPNLADALEDAGCTNAPILEHCRSDGEHVRGCWVVDLLTGRS